MGVTQQESGPSARAAVALTVIAAAAFAAVFRFQRLGPLDFFSAFALAAAVAAGLSLAVDSGYARRLGRDLGSGPVGKAAAGLASAAVLYAVFAAGRALSRPLLPFAAAGIARVYALKSGLPAGRVVLLIGLVIGPAEELFWRGFVQERMAARAGRTAAWLFASLLYAAVHLSSGNAMLVLAAAVCGLFWGGLYARFRSPVLNAASHTAWDLLVFVLFPL